MTSSQAEAKPVGSLLDSADTDHPHYHRKCYYAGLPILKGGKQVLKRQILKNNAVISRKAICKQNEHPAPCKLWEGEDGRLRLSPLPPGGVREAGQGSEAECLANFSCIHSTNFPEERPCSEVNKTFLSLVEETGVKP